MCGICGVMGAPLEESRLYAATDLMRHRGPDEAGYLRDDGIALGMRRLRIIDLAGGAQPKTNESGTTHVIFNGEIYNYRELQRELAERGHSFRSDSDTEVIVHAFEEWGTECFARLQGIFALALWEARERRLVLARDHLGVKPLYYQPGSTGGSVAFASELSPLLALAPVRPTIDPSSVALYVRYGYVPTPRSIYEGIYKLPPGHWLAMRDGDASPDIREFWSPLRVSPREERDLTPGAAEEVIDQALTAAVRRQMVSDVPLGAFLSGGIDSSAVVAMMQRTSNRAPLTFSIGFRESEADESRFAEQVAAHVGTEHRAWIVTEEDALAVIPHLPRYFDEPFGDSSAIPTSLVSQLARQHVTVSLSGDGGDELFGGYLRYARMRQARRWWNIPEPWRLMAVEAAGRLPGVMGRQVRRAGHVLRAPSLDEAYRSMVSVTPDAVLQGLVAERDGLAEPNGGWPASLFQDRGLDEAMMLTDLVTYLPDDILTKVDRASMAHSLEARVPLLDVAFVETVLSLPVSTRLHGGPKALLKRVLQRYIPPELVNRPKHGFSIPLHRWLRTELRDCVTDYLTADAVAAHGFWRPDAMEQLVREHVRGERNRGHALWVLLMFQMWYEHQYHADPRDIRRLAPAT